MKKLLLLFWLGSLFYACSDSDSIIGDTPDTPDKPITPDVPDVVYKRFAFDYAELADHLNKDFTSVCQEFEKYVAEQQKNESIDSYDLGAYIKTESDSLLLLVTFHKDAKEQLGSVTAKLEEGQSTSAEFIAWKYFLENSEHLKLGRFLGTKYKSPQGSGVIQTVEDTLSKISENTSDQTLAHAIFGVIPLNVYAVAGMESGHFTATILNSYFSIDYPQMRSWIGTSHDEFAKKYYLLGNKINMFGDLYVYFDYAKDILGNIFTLSVHADQNLEKISEVDAYVSLDYNDAEQQMAIWRMYVSQYEQLGLGTFCRAYCTDGAGEKKQSFANIEEVIAYVDANHRPEPEQGGVIVVFCDGEIATSLVLNGKFIYVLLNEDKTQAQD